MQLLATKKVAWLAFVHLGAAPILPMNVVLDDDRVSSAPWLTERRPEPSTRRSHSSSTTSTTFPESGWSVVATGAAELPTEEELGRLRLGRAPAPWAEGPRTLFLAIPLDLVTGRPLSAVLPNRGLT